MNKKTKIFVDGNCIVCDAEVSHYKRVAPDQFDLIDISHPEFNATLYGLDPKSVEVNLHVLTPEGQILTGVDAFAHIWSRIKRYSFATRLIKLPLVSPLARLGYKAFTHIRPYLPKKRSMRV